MDNPISLISLESLLMGSLILSFFLVFLFFKFCYKTKVFKKFGRRDNVLSWKQFSILSISAFIPFLGLCISLYISDFEWNTDDSFYLTFLYSSIFVSSDFVYLFLKNKMGD